MILAKESLLDVPVLVCPNSPPSDNENEFAKLNG